MPATLRPITLFFASLVLSTAARGEVTYVDASSGAGGNTTLANGGTFTPPLNATTGADNNWEQRSTSGSGGNIFEAGGENPAENAPGLKMTVSGLTPGGSYLIHAYFWDPGSGTEDWNLRAGPAAGSGSNSLFSAADATADLGGATAAVPASTLNHATAPSVFTESGRNLLAAPVGMFTGGLNATGTGLTLTLNTANAYFVCLRGLQQRRHRCRPRGGQWHTLAHRSEPVP